MNRLCSLIILSIFLPCIALAQQGGNSRIETVTARYTGVYTADTPPAKAKMEVIQQAQIEAIAQTFGTIVSETNLMHNDTFKSFGECDVKGEWIETIGDTIWMNSIEGNNYIYRVTLKGKIRQWNNAPCETDVVLLCNGTDVRANKLRDNKYFYGDSAFVYFKSPVEGDLVIFIDDGKATQVQRLLPYSKQEIPAYHVEANKEYILFSKRHAPYDERPFIRRLLMKCHDQYEANQLYVIFSPNQITRPTDDYAGDNLPQVMDFKKFHKWLSRNRRIDKDMTLKKYIIEIVRNE